MESLQRGIQSGRLIGAKRPQTEGAQSIKRAFSVLRIVVAHGDAGAALKDVALETGLHRATAHRILSALVDENALEFDSTSRRYRLGVEIFALGAAMGDRFDIKTLAKPAMQELCDKTRDTVYLGVRSGYDGLCIDMREGSYPTKALRLHVQDRWPLGVGAFSMPLLAWLPDSEVAEIITHNAPKLSDERDHTPEKLLRCVEETRRRGYAVNYIRDYPGMCGLGVPVLDQQNRPIASLCVVALIRRLTADRQSFIAGAMWTKSRTLSQAWRSARQVMGIGKPWKNRGRSVAKAASGEPDSSE